MQSWMRPLIEAGPLAVFVLVLARGDIYWATGAFMAATAAALIASYVIERRVPLMPLVGGVFVLIFGGLTLYLHDDTFIKLKPTLVNTLFAVTLFGGLAGGRPLLKPLFSAAFQLSDEGWRKLTWRWALFFLFMAATNEVIWRNFSTEFWGTFKLAGFLPMTFVFALAQVPLIQRCQLAPVPVETTTQRP
ncbi:MAG: septation protein A [Alphaproteobacteria bacterium]|nr:septation protein A [Alphaproteobacteria bacterium]